MPKKTLVFWLAVAVSWWYFWLLLNLLHKIRSSADVTWHSFMTYGNKIWQS